MTDLTQSEKRKKRDAAIRAQDDLIAEHIAQAYKSGELQTAESFGRPLKELEGYAETPETLRMPFKILRNAGVAPPEIELFHRRAELRRQVESAATQDERKVLQQRLSELEQLLALRLEAMRVRGSL